MKPTNEERKHLIEVYEDTVEHIKSMDDINQILIKNSKYYSTRFDIKFIPKEYDTKITFVNQDTFDAAKELGQDCAVLNMACVYQAGGGVKKGSKAQEESLCRRSNLMASLLKFKYPIWGVSTLYSPNVTVFKNNNYGYLKEPFTCNVLTAAMVKDPKLEDGKMCSEDLKKVVAKIENLFDVALHNEHRKIVLGAWGCGAYHCPAKDIAQAFKYVINSPKYRGQFEEIRFAIWNNPSLIINNYVIFNEVFNGI